MRAGIGAAALLAAALFGSGCGGSAAIEPGEPAPGPTAVAPYTGGGRVAWDFRTLQRPLDGPASYPRMIRLRNGDLLLSVESRGASLVLISSDDGRTWSAPIAVASPRDGVIAAVPSLLELRGGTVLLAYNPRPPMDNSDPSRRFGIRVAASEDGGRTWRERATVFEAGHRFGDGVWEPAMLQLPSGEVLLFVANESPYRDSNDQEISVFRSADEGRSWSPPQTVSYRPGHRDGMPVPLLLPEAGEIVIAIEDDGIVQGPFKPVIVRIPADGMLNGEVVGGTDTNRWSALDEGSRLPDPAYGGAPYLARFPDGETVLGFQSNEGRRGEWDLSTMVVALGDPRARSFSRKSLPFRVPEGRRALWGSLFVKGPATVTALTTTNAFDPARQELWLIDGHRIPEPRAPRGEVRVDGDGNEAVWGRGTEVLVGAYGDMLAHIRTAWDPERMYARFEVLDERVVDAGGVAEERDAVLMYLAPGLVSRDAPVRGVFRLRVGADGAVRLEAGEQGDWREVSSASVAARLSQRTVTSAGIRYTVEVGVPWVLVGGRPETGAGWGINFGLVDADGSEGVAREWVSGTEPERPSTWLRMELRN